VKRVCVIYDDRLRPETTGGYCLRAFQELLKATHARPDQISSLNPMDFDLFVRIDDGLEYALPSTFHPLVWWAIDTHLDPERCLAQANLADVTFAAQQPGAFALRQAGIHSAEWLPLACDTAIHRQHDLSKRFDFCFVGNLIKGPRSELVEKLRLNFPSHFVGRSYFEDMARIYSESRIAFNRSIRDDLNMRVFEVLACGSLLVTNHLSPEAGQDKLFRDGIHLASYRDPEELIDKFRFYLARPEARAKIERAGREEVTARHTYRHRMERLLTAAARLTRSVPVTPREQVLPPTIPSFDPSYFECARPELLALIPPGLRDVVDVGCGAGRLGAALKVRQRCRVVGIEHNPTAAALARTRLDRVIQGDAETLERPFPPATFDVVVCGDVLEHLRDPLRFLQRVRTWLRPSGVLVTSLPNVRHHSVILGLLAGDWTYESAGLLDNTHLRFFTRREVEKLLYRAKFDVPALIPVPGPGYGEWEAAGCPGEVSVGGLRIGSMSSAEAGEFFTYQWLAAARPAMTPDFGLTSIVILTHNQLPLTRRCVDSIRLFTDESYELVFVDNGSTDGTPEYLKALAAADERVKAHLNPDNRGFPAGCNQGIKIARGAQVLLLNNDTVVTTGWLQRMLRVLHSGPKVGLVGPCSNLVSGEQQVPVPYGGDLSGLDGFAWEWGKTHDRVAQENNRLVGFCLLIRREVIDTIGLMDEGFGVGNYEDDDYCMRARQAGFKTVIARDAFIHHVGGATFTGAGIDYSDLMRRNAERFRSKWGGGNKKPETPTAIPSPPSPVTVSAPENRTLRVKSGERNGLILEPVRIGVSGCLIVRDNATTIRACLGSLRPWVDELVVVDTGSKDGTPKIAAELGARVVHFPWIDDFSAARNESVKHARGEWVFWMDSDDTIDEINGRGLRNLARGPHREQILGYVIRVHCPGAGPDGMNDLTVVDHVKLFRNRPDLRFEHRIHEQILPAIRRAGGEVEWSDLFVLHSGYDHSPNGQARKKDRDLRLLHLDLVERPGHPFTLFNLGMTYADFEEYAKAAGYLEESLSASLAGDSHRRKAFALLAHCRSRIGDLKGALATCEMGLSECPEDLELRFRLGVLLHEAGRFRESVAAYEEVLAHQGERYFTSVDRGIGGFKARQNLAVVYGELGDLDRAEEAWRAVTKEAPSYRLGWRGFGEFLVRRKKLDEAATIATQLIGNPRTAIEGHLLMGMVADARGHADEARNSWEKAASMDSTDPEPLRHLGRIHFESGKDDLAERALRHLITVDSKDASVHHNLGSVLLRTRRHNEAVAEFQRSLELRPDSIETRICLGYALRAIGDRLGAASIWRSVLTIQPGHREATDALASLGSFPV